MEALFAKKRLIFFNSLVPPSAGSRREVMRKAHVISNQEYTTDQGLGGQEEGNEYNSIAYQPIALSLWHDLVLKPP
jgi:hypothetical protein